MFKVVLKYVNACTPAHIDDDDDDDAVVHLHLHIQLINRMNIQHRNQTYNLQLMTVMESLNVLSVRGFCIRALNATYGRFCI